MQWRFGEASLHVALCFVLTAMAAVNSDDDDVPGEMNGSTSSEGVTLLCHVDWVQERLRKVELHDAWDTRLLPITLARVLVYNHKQKGCQHSPQSIGSCIPLSDVAWASARAASATFNAKKKSLKEDRMMTYLAQAPNDEYRVPPTVL